MNDKRNVFKLVQSNEKSQDLIVIEKQYQS